jgi:hypothetical protein
MAKKLLTYEQKYYAVSWLARHRTPSEVAAGLRGEFGLKISRQAVAKYDPTTTTGKKLSTSWRDLFLKLREEFDAEMMAKARQS